ncbi:MAG: hypothetical protein K2O35_02230 [Clostridia bacterium]|nr:hypothetical protein [Clostridia bacterium]
MAEPRQSFEERINEIDEASMEYYNRLQTRLLSYKGMKSRLSLRCDSYRAGKKLLAKITIGGNSLKIYLAIDATQEEIAQKKIRFRDMSKASAYKEVPAMIPVKSELCVRKLCDIIDIMMSQRGLEKV